MSEQTYEEMIAESVTTANTHVGKANAVALTEPSSHLLAAQVALLSAIQAQLMLMTEKLETIELAVSRFDERERYG